MKSRAHSLTAETFSSPPHLFLIDTGLWSILDPEQEKGRKVHTEHPMLGVFNRAYSEPMALADWYFAC